MRVPTLVLYRPAGETEALEAAERIAGSRAVRVSGSDYYGMFLSTDEIVDEIERSSPAKSLPQSRIPSSRR